MHHAYYGNPNIKGGWKNANLYYPIVKILVRLSPEITWKAENTPMNLWLWQRLFETECCLLGIIERGELRKYLAFFFSTKYGRERENPEIQRQSLKRVSHLQPVNYLQIKIKPQCKDQLKGMESHFLVVCAFSYME